MKLIPGKYCFSEDGSIVVPPSDFKIPIWDYISMNLRLVHKNETYLLDLFGITKAALYKWKRLKDDGISKDKLVVLANLFGVSLDQLYERDFNDAFQYEDFYNLLSYHKKRNYKELTYHDLHWLFEKLAEARTYIEYYSIGYIPLEVSEDDPNNDFDRIIIDEDEVRYFCDALSIDVTYYTKDGYDHFIDSITFKELCDISKILKSEWQEDAPKHIIANVNEKYYKIMLLSENIKYLNHAFEKWIVDINYFLQLWLSIKSAEQDFDVDYKVLKLILSKGATFIDDNENIDESKRLELMDTILKEDVKRLLEDCCKEE